MSLLQLLLPMLALSAQPQLSALSTADLAQSHAVDGVIEAAFRIQVDPQPYSLVLSRTGTFSVEGGDGDGRSARLYATLFTETDDGASSQWVIQDLVDACPVDITAAFTDPPVAVSDADADGVPEIWVSYRTACRGDVSPSTLKLIGYEGSQKYALRGTSRIQLGDSHEGGDAQPDAVLAKAPQLLEHARSLWAKVRDEGF